MKHLLLSLALLSLVPSLHAQAAPAATRSGDLTVGAGIVFAHPDYSPQNEAGFAVFGDFNFLNHFGTEVQLKRVGGSRSTSITETSVEFGGRLRWTFHPFLPVVGVRDITPYIKGDVGVGTFNFQNSYQNGSHLLYGGGGGIDVSLIPRFGARVEYEYQRWPNFVPNGLQPNLLTLGITYRLR